MLAKRIIPCLDVHEGRVVKGVRFVDLKDAGEPVEQARFYERAGADELVFLDISASAEGRKTMLDIVRRASEEVFMPFTIGGGISSLDDIRRLLKAGADKVSLNTAAVEDPGLISRAAARFGSQCVTIAVDARRTGPNEWEAWIYGGRKPSGRNAVEWVRRAEELGAGEVLLTSMDRDGTAGGYDIELTRTVCRAVNVPVIASGGAGTPEDIFRVLTEGEAQAALAAGALHYRRYSVSEIKSYLGKRGVPVRTSADGD